MPDDETLWYEAVSEAFGVPGEVPLRLKPNVQGRLGDLWRAYGASEDTPDEDVAMEAFLDEAHTALLALWAESIDVVDAMPGGPEVVAVPKAATTAPVPLAEAHRHLGLVLEGVRGVRGVGVGERKLLVYVEREADLAEVPEEMAGWPVEVAPAEPPVLYRVAAGGYTRVVMFDFDGTLFNSQEVSPEWWDRPGEYSWGLDPLSLEPPCVPEHPGAAYWNERVVQAAHDASADPRTYVVLITGRTSAHEPRIRELLAQRGIRPDALYFNSGVNAAAFKKRIFGTLLVRLPYAQSLAIWENENQDAYSAFVRQLSERLEREIRVEVNHVRERHMPALCGPEDFQARVASTSPRGVGLFIPLPDEVASQFPSLGGAAPHVTLLYVGAVPRDREDGLVAVVHGVLSEERGPVKACLGEVDSFVHPEADRTVWYSRVRFSRDVATLRDRLRSAIEAAGFRVQDRSPLTWFPHVTLAYLDGVGSRYEGPTPKGAWSFDAVEVWGTSRPVEVALGAARSE